MDAESETQVLPRVHAPPAAPLAKAPERPDKLVGRYELLHRLGHGGMATVYLGRARGKAGFEKRVAVKVIHPHLANEPDLVGMFLDEARIAADIHHPHVVETLDLGEDDGVYFMVMEFVEGETLAALMRAMVGDVEPLSAAVALQVLADACEGLGAAHSLRDANGRNRQLVHRDVSPQNLMVSMEGWVKVGDFGIMKAVGKTSHTRPGELRGKLAYMSPEQAKGGEVDHRTDLFALGVIAWELCTGERLFAGDTDAATLEKVMRCEVPRFDAGTVSGSRRCAPELERELAPFFARALAADPVDRFESASEMLGAIRSLQRLVSDTDPRRELAGRMQQKFGTRAEYLRAALRGGSPLRGTTRKRSSLLGVATAARSAAASTPAAAEAEAPSRFGDTTGAVLTPTSSTLTATAGRHLSRWLLLPMLGAGVAVAVMSVDREPEPTPVRLDGEPALPVSAPASGEAVMVRWHFDTTPPGASITIDGRRQPRLTPTSVTLPRGEQPIEVRLEKSGFEPNLARLAPLSDQNFPYRLVPIEPAPPALVDAGEKKKRKTPIVARPGPQQPPPDPVAEHVDEPGPKFKPSPFPDKTSEKR